MHPQLTRRAAKQQAKILGEFLQIPHGKALEAISRCNGFRDWNTAAAMLPEDSPVPAVGSGVRPAVIPSLEPRLIELLDRRLGEAVRHADLVSLDAIRALYQRVKPVQDCISVGQLMDEANKLTAAGHMARKRAMRDVVQSMGRDFGLVGDDLAARALAIAQKHYPSDLFVALVGHTPGVYARSKAPASKFQERVFNVKMSQITVGSLNNRRRALSEIETDLKEWRLATLRDSHQELVTVVYAAEARPHIAGRAEDQLIKRDFESVEQAKRAPMPEGTAFARIDTSAGYHSFTHELGWLYLADEEPPASA